VFLDREREVRAALDRRVVGDDHAFLTLDDADARDDARAGRVAVVDLPGGQGGELQEGAPRVDEPVDPLAGGELAARAMALECLLAAAARHLRRALAQLGDEALHPFAPRGELVRAPLGLRGEHGHRVSLTGSAEDQRWGSGSWSTSSAALTKLRRE